MHAETFINGIESNESHSYQARSQLLESMKVPRILYSHFRVLAIGDTYNRPTSDTTVLIHGCSVLLRDIFSNSQSKLETLETLEELARLAKRQLAKCPRPFRQPTRTYGDPISELSSVAPGPNCWAEERQRRSHAAAADLDNLWQSWRIGGGDGQRRRERRFERSRTRRNRVRERVGAKATQR